MGVLVGILALAATSLVPVLIVVVAKRLARRFAQTDADQPTR
jgi:hypothetical protein